MHTSEPAEGRARVTSTSPTTERPADGPNHAEGPSGSQPNTQGAPERLKSAELYLVDRLLARLPPILSRAEDWFVYDDGVWTMRTRAHYMPEALAIQNPKHRTEQMAGKVLRHIQGKFQVKESPFCGAVKFDGGDILVCVQNGVLRIQRNPGELILEDFSPDHHFTQKLAVPFDPKAVPKPFNKALEENLPDPKDRHLFGLFNASVFVPDCRWEAALCCFGATGTGKSTLFEGIEAMLGRGPCQALSLTQLCDHNSYNGPDLEWAMLNFSTELNALELVSDRFKQLVSGERVSVRGIYCPPFYIRPTCKYAFLTNHLPRFKDGTDAELRRLYFLKFAKIPEKKDLELKKQIASDPSGILNLLVRLVPELLALPESMPFGGEHSEKARERFKVGNNPVGYFVQSECELDPTGYEFKGDLKTRYTQFLERNGLPDKISDWFFRKLYEQFDVEEARVSLLDSNGKSYQARVIAGIKLRNQEHP
jgi:phage/plasmid-associated DNA primase